MISGKGNEGEVCGREHHLQAHEDDNDVATNNDAGEANGKKDAADHEVFVERDWVHWLEMSVSG